MNRKILKSKKVIVAIATALTVIALLIPIPVSAVIAEGQGELPPEVQTILKLFSADFNIILQNATIPFAINGVDYLFECESLRADFVMCNLDENGAQWGSARFRLYMTNCHISTESLQGHIGYLEVQADLFIHQKVVDYTVTAFSHVPVYEILYNVWCNR